MMKRIEVSCRCLAAATALILALGAICPTPGKAQTARPSLLGPVLRPAQPDTPVKGWLSPQAQGQHLVYVASTGSSNFVNIYPAAVQSPQPVGTITNGISNPQGLAVDTAGNLYVANNGNNTVTVYPPGQINPSATYTNGIASPLGLTVGADGTLYVANRAGGSNGFGSVSVYPPGNMNPSEILTLSGWDAFGVVVDSANNLYVLWFDPSTVNISVYKYAPGSQVGTNLGLDVVPKRVAPASQLAFDGAGNLVLSFQSSQGQLYSFVEAFPPGSKEPSLVINLGSLGNVALGFAFSHDFNFLYITLANANVWMQLTYPKNSQAQVLPRNVVNIQGTGLALSPGT